MTLKALFAVPLLALALTAMVPLAGHADDWRGRDDGRGNDWGNNNRGRDDRGRNDWRNDRYDNGRGHGNSWGGPVYFNNRPRVVTRYVPYTPPVVYYQRPPVVYYRDVVYYDNTPDYRVGDRLYAFQSVPQSVLVQLNPPPRGYYYSMGGRDVFLVSHQTNAIAQIISLFVH